MANTIIGIGGCGCKILNGIRTIDKDHQYLIAIDTDQSDLDVCKADKTVLIGKDLVEGCGTGGNTEIGEKAARKATDDILSELIDGEKVFIVTGAGGGTGAGAAPVVAKALTCKNIHVSIIAIEPFEKEGKRKCSRSNKLLTVLDVKKTCSTLIVISNDVALEHAKSEEKSYMEINELVYQIVSGKPVTNNCYIDNNKSFENKCTASDLCSAIENGDEKGAIRLLSNGANPNEIAFNVNFFGTTREPVLYKACIRKMNRLIQLLIKHGADPNAVFSGNDKNGAFEKPILFCAVLAENENMVELLLKSGADPNCSYRKTDRFGKKTVPTICQAIKMRNKKIVNILVENGASVDAVSTDNEQYGSNIIPAVCDVIEWNDEEILNLFACHGVNPNVSSIKQYAKGQIVEPALFAAVEKRRERVAKILIDIGADVNATAISENELGSRRVPVLFEAVCKGLNETAAYMIRLGADVDSERVQIVKLGEEHEPVLYKSVVMHNEQIAMMLLDCGCNANSELSSVDKYGPKRIPAFYEAIVWGNDNLINLMLSKGADTNSELRKHNEYGLVIDPVLFRAVDGQKLSVAQILINKGSNVNAEYTVKGDNVNKSVPTLYKAIHWDDIDLVRLMLSRGVDVNSTKINGNDRKTVLWESIYYNKLPIANMLKSSGADITLIPQSECEELYNDYKLQNVSLIERLNLEKSYVSQLDTNGLIRLLESEKRKVSRQMTKTVDSSDEPFQIEETEQIIEDELSRLTIFTNLFTGSEIHITPFTLSDNSEKHSKKIEPENASDMNKFDEIREYKKIMDEGLISEKDFLYKKESILGIPYREELFESNNDIADNSSILESDSSDMEVCKNEYEQDSSKNKTGYIIATVIITAIVVFAGFFIFNNYNSKASEPNTSDQNLVEETEGAQYDDEELINKIVGAWYLPNSGSDIIVFNDNMTYYVEELSGEKINAGTWQCIDGVVLVAGELWVYDEVNEILTPKANAAAGEHWVKIK